MEINMNISFTGIKNIGGYIVDDGSVDYGDKTFLVCTQLQLTNKGNRDLDEFTNILKIYRNVYNKDSIFLGYAKNLQNGEYKFNLNGSFLEINDVNLFIWEKLAKLFDKLKIKNPNEYELNQSFMDCEDSDLVLSPLCQLYKMDDEQYYSIKQACYIPENAQVAVKRMSEEIENRIYDYFA